MFPNKLARFIALSVMALFLGATSVRAQTVPPPPPDTDGDGITDDVDQCPTSDLSATVVIDGSDTGITNILFGTGCTLADVINEKIDECAANAKNHGKFVSCVSHETNILKRAKVISGREKGKIQSIVAHLHLP